MTRITTIINQKGGVGKTTTAHALATGIRLRGGMPLVVDTDPQGNLSYTMRADTDGPGVYGAMGGDVPAEALIQRTAQGEILPSSLLLAAADIEFSQTGREYLLRDALAPVLGRYSHVIIDSPPTLGILTINAMTASTDIVIPMGADIYSLQGLSQLYETVGKVQRYCNPALRVAGLLITRHNRRSVLTRDLTESIGETAGQLGAHLYRTIVREGIAIREAQTQRSNPYESHAYTNPVLDYQAFVKEYLDQAEEG